MDKISEMICGHVCNRRAQILLPAVMLAPIFILVIYLLFETAKLSMTKVRQQFALDNSAYSQMSTASTYLNGLALINGPLPYRNMLLLNNELRLAETATGDARTVFDIFYAAGAFPALGPSHELGPKGAISNKPPAPESVDWNIRYYQDTRKDWMKEDPKDVPNGKDDKDKPAYTLTDKEMSSKYFFTVQKEGEGSIVVNSLKEYLTIFIRTGSIFASQSYVYKDTTRSNRMFRQSYFLNTGTCKQSECGKQAAAQLGKYVLEAKPMEIEDTVLYFGFAHGKMFQGGTPVGLKMSEIAQSKLFQFAYLTPKSRSNLRKMEKGIKLAQKYPLPKNRFNIDLTQKMKPQVQNSVYLSCPRAGNNCVWPNPLPKYSVRVGL